MSWTPQKIAHLKALWAEGRSAAHIGRRLDVSRNAVIGKIHRLGLERSMPPPPVDPSIVQVDLDLSMLPEDVKGSSLTSPEILIRLKVSSIREDMGEVPVSLQKKPKIEMPPGNLLLGVAEFLYSQKTFEHVFRQTVADMREEYYAALTRGRRWKARMVVVQGYFACMAAAALHLPLSLGKVFGAIWRLGGG